MFKHEEKYCPRCGNSFECKVGDIVNCQCSSVHISPKTEKFLAATFFDCLCSGCLKKIEREVNAAAAYQFPTQKEMLIEGLHYNMENGEPVYTALYNQLRGECCRKNCRNCVYGFNEKSKDQAALH